eukprot:XP_011607416.1 PREDICTED: uncharacterized protein LOC105417157 [Takifugu rubripes]
MAEAFYTGPQMTMDDWQIHNSDNREDHTYMPVGIQHLEASTHVPNRYPRWSEGNPDPLIGGSEGSRFQMGEPAAHLAGLPMDQGPTALSGVRFSPESPENPEDGGQQPEIHEVQPTAVIPPTTRPPTPRLPYLTASAADITQLSRHLVNPLEYYTHLEDLHSEIGEMPTRVYISLRAGLTITARQQIQRIRRQAYNHKRERSLKQLQDERDTPARQLDHARHTALTLQGPIVIEVFVLIGLNMLVTKRALFMA